MAAACVQNLLLFDRKVAPGCVPKLWNLCVGFGFNSMQGAAPCPLARQANNPRMSANFHDRIPIPLPEGSKYPNTRYLHKAMITIHVTMKKP